MPLKLPGILEGETPGDWALRAEAAREELHALVKSGIEWDVANSKLRLLDPQLVEGKGAKIKCIEPFIGSGQSLRELAARWGLIAVLARDELWPEKLPTDTAAREACPVEVDKRSVTRWRCERLTKLDEDIKAAKRAAGDEVNGFFDSSFESALVDMLSPGGSGSNSPPVTGGGSDSGGSASSTNTPTASASGGDDSDGSPAAAEALTEVSGEARVLEGALPELEEADSGAHDPLGTSHESRADESPADLPRPTPQSLPQAVHALPTTEDLEAPGPLEDLDTAEVCELIEQGFELPHSPDATPTGRGARSAGSPPQSSSAAAMGAPAASAPAASAPAAPTAVEPAASPAPNVSCYCGKSCVKQTAGRRGVRTFFRCPTREGGCMFYRRCDRTASYNGPGCKRPDCVCTASYNGKPDEYCCETCRGDWCETTNGYVGGKPCAVPRFEHGPCHHPEPFPEEVNAMRKGSRQTESGPRKGRRQVDGDD